MNIVVPSAMDNISNIPDSFDILKNISQSILPVDININENFEVAPDTVQSYFLRKLEGGYVELIPYNSEVFAYLFINLLYISMEHLYDSVVSLNFKNSLICSL